MGPMGGIVAILVNFEWHYYIAKGIVFAKLEGFALYKYEMLKTQAPNSVSIDPVTGQGDFKERNRRELKAGGEERCL